MTVPITVWDDRDLTGGQSIPKVPPENLAFEATSFALEEPRDSNLSTDSNQGKQARCRTVLVPAR